jgi:LuxR family transcriptional regulator/LuxR family quorum-sensing system transcriptional regulator CciR
MQQEGVPETSEQPPARMSISEFLDALPDMQGNGDLWALSLEFMRGRGVRMVSYHHYGGETGAPLIRTDGFPEDWVEHYVEDRLFLVDPIPAFAARSTEPFFWSDIATRTALLQQEEDYLEELRAARLGEGLGVPVFGPMSCDGYVGLGFGGERPPLRQGEVREMQLAAQAAHLTYCGIVSRQQQAAVRLSPRERDVLFWIARGKSNAMISEIIGISPHTVDTHVRRIFDKLGVADRTTAAIKGMGSGLLIAQPAHDKPASGRGKRALSQRP